MTENHGPTPAILENADKQYATYSAQASTIVRTLAVTAIASAWLFGGGLVKTQNPPPETVLSVIRAHDSMFAALVLAVVALALDLLQYAYSSCVWGGYKWTLARLLLTVPGTSDSPAPLDGWLWQLTKWYQLDRYLADDETRSLSENERKIKTVAAIHSQRRPSQAAVSWFPAAMARPTVALFLLKLLALTGAYAALLAAVV